MRSHERESGRVALVERVASSGGTASVRSSIPARRAVPARNELWTRATVIERMLAADRDDPSFDYAAH
jgi:hypothetical protein